ncbi:MAG: lysophospholipid acyltransferase family protein [Verrucomicrobiota bacterium]
MESSDRCSIEQIGISSIVKPSGFKRLVFKAFEPALNHWLGFNQLNTILSDCYQKMDDSRQSKGFFMEMLRALGIQFEVDEQAYKTIPKSGPLIVVSNHPFGMLDGIIMGAILKVIRDDAKLMGNYLLLTAHGLRDSIIEVDPFQEKGSVRSNMRGIRNAIEWLERGGCLGMFPSGEVSSYQLRSRGITDPKWSLHAVALAKRTGATVLPFFFEGRNSFTFQALGLIHPKIRTFLLLRELCRMRGRDVTLRLGKPIKPDRLKRFDSREAANDYIRLKTYTLSGQKFGRTGSKRHLRFPFRSASATQSQVSLAPEQLKHRLRAEVERLPKSRLLAEQGNFAVYYEVAEKIPTILLEIGRLREATFRAVDEGTGQSRDLDEFDAYYYHLFMWDHDKDSIVGSYRIGLVDRIVHEHGISGLYTSTLFRYGRDFLNTIGPSMELGRSFVRVEYQKKYASLALIWKGVFEFISRHPEYPTLFGAVSIADSYHAISKSLMVHFFSEHNSDQDMSELVHARNPAKAFKSIRGISLKKIGESLSSLDAISAVVSGFEDDEKGIPMLLRHYLKLNGVLLSFNVDPAFSDVIDGLIVVDIRKSDPRIPQRYMGEKAYAEFMEYHNERSKKEVTVL